jgi:hypothetical protein
MTFTQFTFKQIQTYLNKHGIEKKKPIGLPKWQQITKENYNDYMIEGQTNKGIITGEISNITVFDFDDVDVFKQMLSDHPELKDCYTVITRKGAHLYFKYDKRFGTSTNVFEKYKSVDIRNDNGMVLLRQLNIDY